MLTAEEYIDICGRVEKVIASSARQYYGSLSSKYPSSAFDGKSSATAGSSILASQGLVVAEPLLSVCDVGDLTITETKAGSAIPSAFDYETLDGVVSKLEAETAESETSSCRGACTGICLGTCGSGCNGCSGACSTGCMSACSTGCKGYCKNVSKSQSS